MTEVGRRAAQRCISRRLLLQVGGAGALTSLFVGPSQIASASALARQPADLYECVGNYLAASRVGGPFYFFRGTAPVGTPFIDQAVGSGLRGFGQDLALSSESACGFFARSPGTVIVEGKRVDVPAQSIIVSLFPDADGVISYYQSFDARVSVRADLDALTGDGKHAVAHATLRSVKPSRGGEESINDARAEHIVKGRTWRGVLQDDLASGSRVEVALSRTHALKEPVLIAVRLTASY